MRIRTLEIIGFKSFADRVVFAFDEGISAIVGPNGCGKSNVVDAIRWVMGEQNPRHLRGRLMDDIIFAGTERRSPVGMAEVVLTFDATDGRAPEPYAAFSEIQVARRLYGSGESEYLINKVPVRLRDVIDFFLDTGIGTRGYTIVEQGQIASIVSTRAEERRFIIEEAAGIGKYRQRRRETERKLAATEQNLLRVNDILGELRRQIGSLDRQARKANRYKELSAKVRDLELIVAREELDGQSGRLDELMRELESARAVGVEIDTRVARSEARLESERRAHLDREKELGASRERLFTIRSEIQSLESRIEYERRERENLLRLSDERESEIAELEEQLSGHRSAQNEVLTELSTADETESRTRTDVERQTEELAAQTERLAELRGRREGAQARLVELSAEAAGLDGRRDALADRRRELEGRLRQLDESLEASSVTVDASARDQEQAEGRQRKSLQEQDEFGRRLAELLRSHRELAASLEALAAKLRRAREREQHADARLESLREAERTTAEASRDALEALPELERRSIRARLSEVVRVEPGFERALETVLGERLEAVLVEDPDSALRLLGRLREQGSGRATVLAPGRDDDEASSGFVPLGQRLSDKVSVSAPFDGVLRRLVGDVYVVDDLGEAVKRFGVSRPPAVFVTHRGELLDHTGSLTGGAFAAPGSLSRTTEIESLVRELEAVSAERSGLEVRETEDTERLAQLAAEIENARNRRHSAELAVLHFEKDLERLSERRKGAEESAETQRGERGRLGDELERLAVEGGEVAARITALTSERSNAQSEHEAMGARTIELARDVDSAEERLTHKRVELAQVTAKRDQLQTARDRLRASIDEGREWLARRREEVRTARERSESLSRSTAEAESRMAQEIEREEAIRTGQESVQDAYERSNRLVEEAEAGARGGLAEREALRERMSKAELAKQEAELRRDQLLERVRDKYHVDLATFVAPADLEPRASEERQAELENLQRSLQSLGDVHLGAIEEYEEVSERFRYLTEQKDDLETSIEKLRSAITRINRTSRARFRETFEAVNDEFQKLFPRLFRGGRAHLSLTDTEDVLEAGIEISAQPPGKKLQSVNLLSGGEKSLTAIALLFAVFAVRPSPFFLLDEVDAALDDANVSRFNDLVTGMAERSQFLLITHNKGTIEIARTLFGVTMEQPGLSKLVTVDLVE